MFGQLQWLYKWCNKSVVLYEVVGKPNLFRLKHLMGKGQLVGSI